jgi:MFS family permease
LLAFASKDRIVAAPGTSRLRVVVAALAIHLCIGQAYAFSVFNIPLTKIIGITSSAPGDWKLTELGWVFSVAIGFLGLSAALFGTWVESAGPRASGLASAVFFSSGLLVGALGVKLHVLALLIFGYGVLGGVGLGLGYITPVSTLIKWFPDRRGMATGIAIMGFGGGAIIAAPLSRWLMKRFASGHSVGVAETFVVLAVLYGTVMTAGAMTFRLPREEIARHADHPLKQADFFLTTADAVRTRQFFLLWIVLCFNVTAGIGVLGQASAMIQEVFKGRVSETQAASFVALLSASNMVGRFVWASLSDRIGRRATYAIFFALGTVLYLSVPSLGDVGSISGFVICFALILSMYGGGFATIPAYLSDLFGTRFVSAIHGRLLTAWSVAGVLGPVIFNYVRAYQIESGVPKAAAYNLTMRLMAILLVFGFISNFLIKPLNRARAEIKSAP